VHLGIAAVGKPNGAANPFIIPNESIAAEIGRYLRLPIPPWGIVLDGSSVPHFASLNFNLTGQTLPPIIPAQFCNVFPGQVGNLLVFDAYIANSDRHANNLSADYSCNPTRFNVFDHSHCLLSATNPNGIACLARAQQSLVIDGSIGGSRHCLIDNIDNDGLFLDALDRIENIPDWYLDDIVDSAAAYGLAADQTIEMKTFLKARRHTLRQLISNGKGQFHAITNWSQL